MKLKKIIVGVAKEDIISFLKLQNKIDIIDVNIDNRIKAIGQFEFMKIKIGFEIAFNIFKVEHNNVFININNIKILKMNIINSISKKVFNYIINAFTEVEGVSFEDEYFKLDIQMLLNKYYKKHEVIDLNELEIKDVSIQDNEIEIIFGSINVNSKAITEEIEDGTVIDVESQIISGEEEEVAITIDEIKKYEKSFDEQSFFNKIKKYGKSAGISVIYAALILYYTYMDKNVPLTAKAISLGALGYFIIPTDLIPDFILLTGYGDDCIALITAIKSITAYINKDIKSKARNRLEEWFEDIDEKELESINAYL